VLPTIAHNCAKLLVFKDFGGFGHVAIATVNNASTPEVGTKMGTVGSLRFAGMG
jgi:hypothetical protein